MKYLKTCITPIAAAVLLFAGAQAEAVVVAPGSDVVLPGTTAAAEPWLAGTVLEDDITHFSFALSGGGTLAGDIQERVVRETSTGTLDFYWRIHNVTGGSLGSFRLTDFVYGTFDANYRTDGLGAVAPSVGRHFGGTEADSFNFVFQDPANGDTETLGSGDGSYFLFLHTSATQYAETASFDVATNHNGISSMYTTFAPAVPEPETYAMLLAGLGMVGAVARRRRQS